MRKKKKISYLITIVWSEEDQCYIAEAPELEGCVTHGSSIDEAARQAQDAIESWIRVAKKLNHPIPEPVATRRVSGKFNVRLPRNLHKELVIKAAQEKVSLNYLITSYLSHAA